MGEGESVAGEELEAQQSPPGCLAGSGEGELRNRFDTRVERFVHGAFAAELLLPASADALIDVSEFNTDERLPYWADLWPAARALARHLLDAPPRRVVRALELGAGIALPSLVLRFLGVDVIASDYYDDALRFARANAERNGMAPLRTERLDWRESAARPRRFDLILAADVLYERRNIEPLLSLLPRLLRAGGRVLVADPDRVYLAEFRERALRLGWAISEEMREEQATEPDPKQLSRIRILEMRRTS
jgi:predicted nicotinamide N-methyase